MSTPTPPTGVRVRLHDGSTIGPVPVRYTAPVPVRYTGMEDGLHQWVGLVDVSLSRQVKGILVEELLGHSTLRLTFVPSADLAQHLDWSDHQ